MPPEEPPVDQPASDVEPEKAEAPPLPEPTYAIQDWAGLNRYVCLVCGWGHFDWPTFKPHVGQVHGVELILAPAIVSMVPDEVHTASGLPPTHVSSTEPALSSTQGQAVGPASSTVDPALSALSTETPSEDAAPPTEPSAEERP